MNRLSGEVKVTYTWLSGGMSPAVLLSGAALVPTTRRSGRCPSSTGSVRNRLPLLRPGVP